MSRNITRRFGVMVAAAMVAQTLLMSGTGPATAAPSAPGPRTVPPIASPVRAPSAVAEEQRSFSSTPLPAGAEPEPGRAAAPLSPSTPAAAARAKVDRAAPPAKPATAAVARQAGEEIFERRTERSKTFATATPDRFKTQVFGGPVHYRSPQTGQWADIATTLVDAAPGRIRNGAGPVSVDLARDQARGPLARVGLDDDHSVAFSLQGTAPGRARVDDNRVTYAGVRPQVDLELTAVPDGVKEDIVLHSPAAAGRFVFELDLKGLTAGLRAGSGCTLTDRFVQ